MPEAFLVFLRLIRFNDLKNYSLVPRTPKV